METNDLIEDENEKYYKPLILYKSVISNDLKEDILSHYHENESKILCDGGSRIFPKRKVIKEIPDLFTKRLNKELVVTMSQYYTTFIPDINNIRVYHSNYGIVKPHIDIPTNSKNTHTCIIYLTDDFYGGNLSVKIPRTQEHFELFNQLDKKNLTITIEPCNQYGIIFPKNKIHFTDELLGGDKIILIVDCEIIY